MSERNLFRGMSDFEGSIDDDGRLYDENHQYVGRIEGDDIYDNGGVRQGRIDASGKLWDIDHNYVGEAHGSNFIGPTYESTGMSRGDSFGDGDGSEYGALMMLKKRNRYYSGEMPDGDYNFGNSRDDDDYDSDDDCDDEDYGADDDYGHDDYSYACASSRGGARQPQGGHWESRGPEDDLRGCCFALICSIVFVLFIIYGLFFQV